MLRLALAIARIIGLAANLHRLFRRHLPSSKSHIHKTQFKDEKRNKDGSEPQPRVRVVRACGGSYNSNAFDALGWRKPILGNVREALADSIKDALLGMVVTASITKHPDLRKIQENIASQLGLSFNHRSKDKRAMELIHRIKDEQSILIVIGDLYKGFELSKVGIPYGADHKGCKVLLASTSEDVLSNHIHTQKNFMV